jgi:hypothetical protein
MDPHRQQADPITTFLVEGYWPDVRIETFPDAARRLVESVAGLRREGFAIRQVAAALIPGDEAALWIVNGPSAEVIELAYARAGVSIDRIVRVIAPRTDSAWSRASESEPGI